MKENYHADWLLGRVRNELITQKLLHEKDDYWVLTVEQLREYLKELVNDGLGLKGFPALKDALIKKFFLLQKELDYENFYLFITPTYHQFNN